MSPQLKKFLELEKAIMMLDDINFEVAADILRDASDPVWLSLTDEEKQFLNSRGMLK